ncbi:MAG: (Fe-S)-binding protein [Bryobacterales bacterium]|nr:(Fe-S)-binding protein [Bryobacterales bacterium]
MIERIVLIGVTVASVGYFALAVRRRLAPMLSAKERNLPSDRFASRLWTVFCEVMLQTHVIRERPLPGLLHALVMWGFFAFAWVSVEHFAVGFGLLDPDGVGHGWYGAFAAVWAVAVLAGIGGLSFRRFVLRPRALGETLSRTSAIVAALISVLMLTYLLDWGRLDPVSPGWRVNWWVHTVSLLGMLWLIPNSKHLHLVLAPVAIFFRGKGTSAMRPLRDDDDDDFGMLAFSDLSSKDVLDVHSCVECGRCTDHCPANLIGGSLDPKQIVLQLQKGLLAGGDVVAGDQPMVDRGAAWITEDDLFQCFTCGACEQACPVGIEHVGMKILDLRRGLVSEGRTANPKLTDMFNTMERAPHNAWGASHQVRAKLLESAGLPRYERSAEWLLWLGCGCSYDPHGHEVVRAMQRILTAAGLSWGVLASETCCGEPARRAGNEYLYWELSEQVISALRANGVRKIVTCDPHCARMFDSDYRQQAEFSELGIEVMHHTELLASLVGSLNLQGREGRVTLHDPCYSARGRGVVEQPRQVLRALGADLREMRHHGERTLCCGAGGAQLFIADDSVEHPGGRANYLRFDEARRTGARTIATACPYCPIMLSDAAGHAGTGGVRVADVAELVAERLTAPAPADRASG